MWKAIKYKAHNEDFTELLWPEKKTAEQFRLLRDEAQKNGALDGYSQEYLNTPLDESNSFYKRGDFLPIAAGEQDKPLNYYITVDLAIAETEKADYSVFIVAGVDEQKRIHIKHVIRERLDGRDLVETFMSLQREYDPIAIGVEDMQVSKTIGPFLREEMFKQNTFINLYMLKHNGKDKPSRSKSMQARMRAHGVRFDMQADWYPILEDELLTFPRGRKDDQADAFAYLGLMLDILMEAPTRQEQEEDDYLNDLEESGLNMDGRSEITGY
jgi:predicted phage terminase large subunit-like protein